MWNRRDWDDFFVIVRKRWSAHRPPRPVDLSHRNRLVPTEGYSLAELDQAGLSIEQAEYLGLPVDAGRVGSYGPNVTTLREFFPRQPFAFLNPRALAPCGNPLRQFQPRAISKQLESLIPKRCRASLSSLMKPPVLALRIIRKRVPAISRRLLDEEGCARPRHPFGFARVRVRIIAQAQDAKPLLLRQPTLSRTDIAFMYGDDLWKVSRDGGDAIRLTAGPGIKRGPHFSPDGQWIAFTGEYDGKLNVYVISASGGTPRRVTFHAGPDIVTGWTPDGKNILFASPRDSFANGTQALFTVPVRGGFPTKASAPARLGRLVFTRRKISRLSSHARAFWKLEPLPRRHLSAHLDRESRGFQRLKLPHEDWNDLNPLWVGDTIYFLSDRNGAVHAFRLRHEDRTRNRRSSRIPACPIKSADAGPGAIVYEQFGSLHLYDLSTHHEQLSTSPHRSGPRPSPPALRKSREAHQ